MGIRRYVGAPPHWGEKAQSEIEKINKALILIFFLMLFKILHFLSKMFTIFLSLELIFKI